MPRPDKCEAGNQARWPGAPPLTGCLAYREAAMSAKYPASVETAEQPGCYRTVMMRR